MGLINTIKMHAAIASGNFGRMFEDVRVPPLPAAVARVLEEINSEEPDVGKLEAIIASEPEFSLRVLSTVNSSLFALRAQVTSVRHGITLLGFDRIRSVVLTHSMIDALKIPEGALFDHESYWTDTLLRSLAAKSLARRVRPDDEEEAFTAALVSDVALPVLLTSWERYYEPVIDQWLKGDRPLHEVERDAFDWDHAQAGAWILQHWDFPERLVCLVGAHTLDTAEIRKYGLDDSVAGVIAGAARLPGSREGETADVSELFRYCRDELGLDDDAWPEIAAELREQFEAIYALFGLAESHAAGVLEILDDGVRRLTGAPCA